MALYLQALSFIAINPHRLAGFWANALGWNVHNDNSGNIELVPTDGTRFTIVFLPTDGEKKQSKNRLHLDLTSRSRDEQTKSVERLLTLGASHIDIGQGPDDPHVVLADPEGNEFCIIEPENSFLAGCGRLGSITCDGSRDVGYFWSEALGWPLVWDQGEETAIRAPDGTGPFITWGPPIPPKTERNRLHLTIAPSAGDDLTIEVDRLIALGGKRADTDTDQRQTAVMLDPDGNEFSVLAAR